MPPSPTPSANTVAPQWHWQPWDGRGPRGGVAPDAAWRAAHAWLASLPGVPADALPLRRDAHGKPRVREGAGFDAGWSHSGDGLLLAFARGAVLGVDMEFDRPRPKALDIARRHFTRAEAAWLESHAAEPVAGTAADGAATVRDAGCAPRDLAFLRLWCAKEAVLKAHGRGLAFGLHRIVFAERDGALALVEADPALGDASAWSLHEFVPHPGYRAELRHRNRAALVRRSGEFRFQVGKIGTARTRAGRIARLRHEARNDAMEHHAVIESFARQLLDARDMVRRHVGF